MTHPIVDLELDPRGRKQIESVCGLEFGAREQLLTDHTRARFMKPRPALGPGRLQRHVTSETGTDRSHIGLGEVVETSVDRAFAVVRRLQRRIERRDGIGIGVDEVQRAQLAANADQHGQRQRFGQMRPTDHPVDGLRSHSQDPLNGTSLIDHRFLFRTRADCPGKIVTRSVSPTPALWCMRTALPQYAHADFEYPGTRAARGSFTKAGSPVGARIRRRSNRRDRRCRAQRESGR